MLYHKKIIETLLPLNTNRRKNFELVIKSGRIVVNEGFESLWIHYNKRKYTKNTERLLKVNSEKIQKVSNTIALEDWTGQKIIFPVISGNPEVSIIIPVHNNAKFTFNCLKSISKNTQGSFEIVVVDDASEDETPRLLKSVKNIKIIRNSENRGFIDSCNKGAGASSGKYLLFLNNDTIVTEYWFDPLKDAILKDNVGAVGAKLVYPDGKLQEAGGVIWNDASGWNYGKYEDPNKPEYNFVREADYCSGAVLLVKKDLFEKFGGFDERFKPGYYEDADLCFSIRKLGYRVLYQPKSGVIHFEGATGGTDINTGVKKHQEINRQKFYEKWKDVLESDHYNADAVNFLHPVGEGRPRKSILIIDRYVPTYDKDAGSFRIWNILKILSELGHKVTFIGDDLMQHEGYAGVLQQYGVEVVYSPYIQSIHDYLVGKGNSFDVVILSRFHIAANHISAVKKYCSKAKIFLDTVDLEYLREFRRAAIENDENILKHAEALKTMDFNLAKECDITLVVSSFERDIMLKESPLLQIEILSIIHEIYPPTNSFSERKNIMFLGGFDHLPNVDAVKFFVQEIFPGIKREIPDIKFYIVGSNPPKEIMSLRSDDTIVSGYVKDLLPYFENCRALVAPLRYGAGIKGKIVEAMAHGLPVVTTSIGTEGMDLTDGKNILIADTPEEFARKVVILYNDGTLWNKLSDNSLIAIDKKFSYNFTKTQIERVLKLYDTIDQKDSDVKA